MPWWLWSHTNTDDAFNIRCVLFQGLHIILLFKHWIRSPTDINFNSYTMIVAQLNTTISISYIFCKPLHTLQWECTLQQLGTSTFQVATLIHYVAHCSWISLRILTWTAMQMEHRALLVYTINIRCIVGTWSSSRMNTVAVSHRVPFADSISTKNDSVCSEARSLLTKSIASCWVSLTAYIRMPLPKK